MASSGFARYARGTGARRIQLPLPALRGSTEPENGSPVSVYFESAALTVPPISKQRPGQLRVLPLNERLLRELENYWRAQRQGEAGHEISWLFLGKKTGESMGRSVG